LFAPILFQTKVRSFLKTTFILYAQPLANKNIIPNDKGTTCFVDIVYESTYLLIEFLVNVGKVDFYFVEKKLDLLLNQMSHIYLGERYYRPLDQS
jgi:hypothetical protein